MPVGHRVLLLGHEIAGRKLAVDAELPKILMGDQHVLPAVAVHVGRDERGREVMRRVGHGRIHAARGVLQEACDERAGAVAAVADDDVGAPVAVRVGEDGGPDVP